MLQSRSFLLQPQQMDDPIHLNPSEEYFEPLSSVLSEDNIKFREIIQKLTYSTLKRIIKEGTTQNIDGFSINYALIAKEIIDSFLKENTLNDAERLFELYYEFIYSNMQEYSICDEQEGAVIDATYQILKEISEEK